MNGQTNGGKERACSLKDIADVLNREDDFLLFSHVSPDGDTLGSNLALMTALKKMGKKVQSVVDGHPPHALMDMPGFSMMEEPGHVKEIPRCAIAIDCADTARLGEALPIFESAPIRLVIDHHISNEGFGDWNYIDAKSAATGEIMVALLEEMGVALDEEIARYLYIAIASDTGGFAYSNTRGATLRAAAQLLDVGIPFASIYDRLFRERSVAKSRMVGTVLSRFSLRLGGKMISSVLDWATLLEINAADSDSDGIVEQLRDVEGVEIAVYIREFASGKYKVSLRSMETVDVAAIAGKFGGGGHIRAAGFTWTGRPEEILSLLEKEAATSLGINR